MGIVLDVLLYLVILFVVGFSALVLLVWFYSMLADLFLEPLRGLFDEGEGLRENERYK